jgi:hypothetical protein
MRQVIYLSPRPERVRLADDAGPIDSGAWFSPGLGITAGVWALRWRLIFRGSPRRDKFRPLRQFV